MTRAERLQLLKLQMLRCIELIDTTEFDNNPDHDNLGEYNTRIAQYEWYIQARKGRAELIAKMHEIRRDTIAVGLEHNAESIIFCFVLDLHTVFY